MRSFVFALVLISWVAYSQQNGQDKKAPANHEQQGTEKKPFVIKIAPTPKTEEEAKRENDESAAKQRAENLRQKADADLANYTGELSDYTYRLFWVGAIQAGILLLTWIFIWRQETATKTIARAYVQLSHANGLTLDGAGNCRVPIEAKNYGTTPARVTRIFLTKRVLPSGQLLPNVPDYSPESNDPVEPPTEALLMKDGNVVIGFQCKIDPADIPQIQGGNKQLYVYGFVDYTDQFNQDFRGGYGRRFEPNLFPNNLVFVVQPRYNYDRKRKRGQGNEYA